MVSRKHLLLLYIFFCRTLSCSVTILDPIDTLLADGLPQFPIALVQMVGEYYTPLPLEKMSVVNLTGEKTKIDVYPQKQGHGMWWLDMAEICRTLDALKRDKQLDSSCYTNDFVVTHKLQNCSGVEISSGDTGLPCGEQHSLQLPHETRPQIFMLKAEKDSSGALVFHTFCVWYIDDNECTYEDRRKNISLMAKAFMLTFNSKEPVAPCTSIAFPLK